MRFIPEFLLFDDLTEFEATELAYDANLIYSGDRYWVNPNNEYRKIWLHQCILMNKYHDKNIVKDFGDITRMERLEYCQAVFRSTSIAFQKLLAKRTDTLIKVRSKADQIRKQVYETFEELQRLDSLS